jgi:hypothetical protein
VMSSDGEDCLKSSRFNFHQGERLAARDMLPVG